MSFEITCHKTRSRYSIGSQPHVILWHTICDSSVCSYSDTSKSYNRVTSFILMLFGTYLKAVRESIKPMIHLSLFLTFMYSAIHTVRVVHLCLVHDIVRVCVHYNDAVLVFFVHFSLTNCTVYCGDNCKF